MLLQYFSLSKLTNETVQSPCLQLLLCFMSASPEVPKGSQWLLCWGTGVMMEVEHVWCVTWQVLAFGFTFHFTVSYIQGSEELVLIIIFSIPNRTLERWMPYFFSSPGHFAVKLTNSFGSEAWCWWTAVSLCYFTEKVFLSMAVLELFSHSSFYQFCFPLFLICFTTFTIIQPSEKCSH